ncbi:uncharacterized protein RCC_12246 [Ramularia collo-cygni]|uniref:Uncharacterized protein n=1 Tax=Ramularia collo-cygni TaxID=112498 RepID=A0A2D3UV03_9PEZI|nr:uncharacterized protein RCC_12246 [Ramularia collo-cygni]CZT14786.1 uncharacterized protein RCC_12246 [Ramularia collo-cygni]
MFVDISNAYHTSLDDVADCIRIVCYEPLFCVLGSLEIKMESKDLYPVVSQDSCWGYLTMAFIV